MEEEEILQDTPFRFRTHRLLTTDEEASLCSEAQSGSESARNQMVESNLRLVMNIAGRFRGKSLTYSDMVQEGALGLLTAIQKFDPARGHKFSTYATYWIRQAIARAIEKQDRIIRIPSHGHTVARKGRRAEDRLYERNGCQPTMEEIAEEAEFDESQSRTFYRLPTDAVSLDSGGADQDGAFHSAAMGDFMVSETALDPEEVVLFEDYASEVRSYLHVLPKRQRQVIELRFGFETGIPMTCQEIADIIGVTRQAINAREKEGLARLRYAMKHGGFEPGC